MNTSLSQYRITLVPHIVTPCTLVHSARHGYTENIGVDRSGVWGPCPECERTFPTTRGLAVHRARWCRPGLRPASRQANEEEGICCIASTSGHGRRVARVGVPVRLPRVAFHQRRRRHGGHAPSRVSSRVVSTTCGATTAYPGRDRTPVTEAVPLRSERLLDPDTQQRGVDANAKTVGNAQRIQLPPTTPHLCL